jgi:chromosome segregation and condensation protein ScpB
MDYFGLKNLNELPQLKDISPEENEIGLPQE